MKLLLRPMCHADLSETLGHLVCTSERFKHNPFPATFVCHPDTVVCILFHCILFEEQSFPSKTNRYDLGYYGAPLSRCGGVLTHLAGFVFSIRMAYIASCAIPDAATNMALKHIGQALSQVGIHADGLLATSNERCSPLQDPDPFDVFRRAVMVTVTRNPCFLI